jgi:hypothetical protein
MKLHDIAVAAAALSFTGAGIAAGTDVSTSSPSSSSGQEYSANQQKSSQAGTSVGGDASAMSRSGRAGSLPENDLTLVKSVQQALKDR